MTADPGCTFCAIANGELSAEVVADEDEAIAFLDARPVFKGHTLVIPRDHVETLPELPEPLLVPVFALVQRVAAAMQTGLDAHGSWIPINNVVSQSVPHLHVHVVPRRRKDGLRGFFWPREAYESPAEMSEYADRLRSALRASERDPQA